MIHHQPFGEVVGAVGPVRHLDVKVGGDTERTCAKEFVPPMLFRVVLLSVVKICQVAWTLMDVM